MSDIIFVNPPYEQIAAGNDHLKHIINRSPSLGLLLLAAQARKNGYMPKIIESDLENLSPQAVAEIVLKLQPKFVAITLFSVGVFNASVLAKLIKEHSPEITILVGGPHISSMGYETMQKFSQFDIAVVYEGELILEKLLACIDARADLGTVEGIIYRENSTLKTTPSPPTIKDLDSLPMPAWDILPNFPDAYLPAIYDYPRAPVATYSASRGCPFKCAFCDTSTFGAKVRYNSPQKVHEIMKHLSQRYGVKHLQFVDDLFVAHNARVLKLCELLIADKIDMTWSCTARVDTVTKTTLQKMKQAGCWEISFGLESGSNEMLRAMKKSITAEISQQAIEWTHEAGIRVKGLFMLGYPGETNQSIHETKEFLKRVPLTTMNLSKFTPYPGSPIYKELYNTAIREEDWERLNGMNFVYEAEGFSAKTLDKEYQEILKTFYKRPHILLHYAKMSLANRTHLKRLMRFFIAFIYARSVQEVEKMRERFKQKLAKKHYNNTD